jgi:cyclophilin family peptidyl-prolyl cis-trans isomerase
MLRQQRINQFRIAILVLMCLFVMFVSGCAQQDQKTTESSTEQAEDKQETETTTPEAVIKPATDSKETETEAKPAIDPANAIAVIETAKGDIEFEFFASDAPQASKNFIKNVSSGFYRGETFHTVEPLYIQAGYSFADDKLAIEKSEHLLEKGTVLMVKEDGASVTDGDEFMICKDSVELDGDQTILGKIIKGLDVLDSIEKNDKIANITIRERDNE